MGSEANLKLWISDKLMSLLGYSQSTVVQYVIGLTKLASSPADVVGTLVEFGLSSSGETRAFAKVIARFPRKSGGVNLYQKQEREAAMLARKQKIYQLLDSNKKRFRRKSANQDKDEDNEVAPSREEDRRVKRRTSGGNSDNDDGSESEEERLRDQREREELERQIRKWDAAWTQKLTEPKMSKEEEEEAIRRSNALEKDDLEALRKVSRQEYLKKREEKKLEELRDEIEDEQYLFEGFELTEAERRELRYKKEIYELVTKRGTEDAGEISEVY